MYGRHNGWAQPQMESRRQDHHVTKMQQQQHQHQQQQHQQQQQHHHQRMPPPHSRIVDQNEYDHYEYAQQRDEYNRYYTARESSGYLMEAEEERRGWQQQQQQHPVNPTELYENVPQANVRNVARIQISAADSAERERELEKERERLWKEQQRENCNSIKSPQCYDYNQNIRPEEEMHKHPNVGRTQQFNGGHNAREQHIRFESAPQPFHSDKHDFINGFGEMKSSNEDRGERKQAQKKESSQTTGAIRAIINNLKGGGGGGGSSGGLTESPKTGKNGDDRKEIPRHKVSTNPFLRNNDKSPTKLVSVTSVKNVAEVVQKMNSGDWPIRIEEDEEERRREERERTAEEQRQADDERVQNLLEAREQRQADKARQWETLDRKRTERRQIEQKANAQLEEEMPTGNKEQPKEIEMVQQHHQNNFPARQEADRRVERVKDEPDKLSDRSEGHTTMSTDSALYSDDAAASLRVSLPFDLQTTLQRKPPQNVKELNEESEKLLLYFKGHRTVLNYLGIGLSEPIWHHINQLPDCTSEIRISKSTTPTVKSTLHPHTKISQSSPQQHQNIHKMESSYPTAEHHQTEILKEVSHVETNFRHDAGLPLSEQRNNEPKQQQANNYTSDGSEKSHHSSRVQQQYQPPNSSPSSIQADSRGRFVKRSAAALISKKQGCQMPPDAEQPNSAEIVDQRIATEIRNYRQREEELKRTRGEVAPRREDMDREVEAMRGNGQIRKDPISPASQMVGGMRPAQSLTHLHHLNGHRQGVERSASSHNLYHQTVKGEDSPVEDDYFSYSCNSQMNESVGQNRYGSEPRPIHGIRVRDPPREQRFFREPTVDSSARARRAHYATGEEIRQTPGSLLVGTTRGFVGSAHLDATPIMPSRLAPTAIGVSVSYPPKVGL